MLNDEQAQMVAWGWEFGQSLNGAQHWVLPDYRGGDGHYLRKPDPKVTRWFVRTRRGVNVGPEFTNPVAAAIWLNVELAGE